MNTRVKVKESKPSAWQGWANARHSQEMLFLTRRQTNTHVYIDTHTHTKQKREQAVLTFQWQAICPIFYISIFALAPEKILLYYTYMLLYCNNNYFEVGSQSIALASLKLTMQTTLSSNSQSSACVLSMFWVLGLRLYATMPSSVFLF